jgi:protein ImuB
MTTRILSLYFPNPPSPEALPEFATLLLSFSPRVGIRPPDTLYLDLTPTARLLPAENILTEKLRAFFRAKSIRAQVAIADDVATAGVLARHEPKIVPHGESEKALAPLPIHSLLFLSNPLSPPTPEETKSTASMIEWFPLLGIRTLGEFAHLPASTIPQRFGSLGAALHRRARGAETLPLRPFTPSVVYRESQSFENPIALLEPLLFIIKGLLTKLEQRLSHDSNAATNVTLFLETEAAQEMEVSIPLANPIRRANAWLGVVREKLARIEIPDPLISLTIEISLPIRFRGGQFHLFDSTEGQREPLDELLGRLIASLGPTVVSAAELRERYRPERSWEGIAFDPFRVPEKTSSLPPRPTLLLSPPTPLTTRVAMVEGPERVQGEWWDGGEHARDYFVAQADGGQLLWIFKDLKSERLFLHGYFD